VVAFTVLAITPVPTINYRGKCFSANGKAEHDRSGV